jgi:hypothetical protein
MDSNCEKGVRDVQKRTMHFLRHLERSVVSSVEDPLT